LRAFVREPSLPFARHRGFEPSRSAQWATISLSEVGDAPLAVPSGIEVVTFADLDPQSVYIADGLVSADEPNDVPTAPQSYEAWTQDVWLNPDIDYSCSVACVEGAAVVALSIVLRDGNRVWSDMTGTIRSHRGRGLAFLAKSSALRHAAQAGATNAFTGVDSENAAMLAINHRLGYRTVDTMWSCLKSL
jgi:hypothetical protein